MPRALCEAMVDDLERITLTRELVAATPALQAGALLMMWRGTEVMAEHLVMAFPAGADSGVRAQTLAACIAAVVRTAVFAWQDGGCRGSPWGQCRKAMRIVAREFARGTNDH
jgi:hypothetical protein